MAPTRKLASVSHKSRPAVRIASFRDDSSLVALRYEKTKQAEPPIPLPPPKNPRRIARSRSAVTAPGSPIVIPPPTAAPPYEDHPFFRIQSSGDAQADARKRDSGMSPTLSSVKLRDEESEADDKCARGGLANHRGDVQLTKPGGEAKPAASRREDRGAYGPLISPETTKESSAVQEQPVSPTRSSSASSILAKALSMRRSASGSKSGSGKWLRKGSRATDDQGALSDSAWGSLKSQPVSPTCATDGPPISIERPTQPARCNGSESRIQQQHHRLPPASADTAFSPITTSIPTDSLLLDEDLAQLTFSKRGSIMFGGKRPVIEPAQPPMEASDGKGKAPPAPAATTSTALGAAPARTPARTTTAAAAAPTTTTEKSTSTAAVAAAAAAAAITAIATTTPPLTTASGPGGDATDGGFATEVPPSPSTHHGQPPEQTPAPPEQTPAPPEQTSAPLPNIRLLPVDVERDSQKVRSLYDSGEGLDWRDGARLSAYAESLGPPEAEGAPREAHCDGGAENHVSSHRPLREQPRSVPPRALVTPQSPRPPSLLRDSSPRQQYELAGGLEDWEDVDVADVDRYGFICPKGPDLRLKASQTNSDHLSPPRKRTLFSRRPLSSYSASNLAPDREPGRKVSARSLHTQASEFSMASRRSARNAMRQATNMLPHNKDRRWMDEAGDMLSLAPGLTDIAEDKHAGKLAEASKRKEWQRSEKWRKMAKVGRRGRDGEGMEFEFDTKNQKLIDRTWKGIPDRWRSAAWYSFLASSARARRSSEPDEYLSAEFHRLQQVSSPDDVQIDLDVPRTINRHIMFRRRYRGGQRLLFRVLHAISLYFPGTGYVQGMASLAATLLCYYDEERCFVMLVRMWRYRGMERLYQPGFDGLMEALRSFEKQWLDRGPAARKLHDLCIDPTAYGTRWYLTLFNLSMPFAAQLRVWDVFMLLGDGPAEGPSHPPHGGGAPPPLSLDVLHATGAALIDALRDVLLGSDFENAMKALTSWVPVKDEEMLMKVTRAEWKRHQGRRRP